VVDTAVYRCRWPPSGLPRHLRVVSPMSRKTRLGPPFVLGASIDDLVRGVPPAPSSGVPGGSPRRVRLPGLLYQNKARIPAAGAPAPLDPRHVVWRGSRGPRSPAVQSDLGNRGRLGPLSIEASPERVPVNLVDPHARGAAHPRLGPDRPQPRPKHRITLQSPCLRSDQAPSSSFLL